MRSGEISKAEKAYELLRRDILDAHLAPETPLTISSLKERYELGWTPLREALSRLETERLVTFSPNRGYRVAGVSRSELLDLQRARVTIESDLLREAIHAGDETWEQQLVAAHYALKQAKPLRANMPETELIRWEQRHDAFHNALLNGSPSIWLKRFAEQISTQLHRHHRNLVFSPTLIAGGGADLMGEEHYNALLERASNVDHHTALMEATLQRDEKRAIELLVEHIGLTLLTYEGVQPR
ncbi:GntR family transcriptional regulator [Rhizobium sp. KVB221]|uniref:GntR family transcriptional regulator n=2 Tax=Rhizobium setariae TaxID=2801340 RepID=A0A937CQT5_9HYPH|nr:GntR family transcriptional regulator [Rhizobium setariae]